MFDVLKFGNKVSSLYCGDCPSGRKTLLLFTKVQSFTELQDCTRHTIKPEYVLHPLENVHIAEVLKSAQILLQLR